MRVSLLIKRLIAFDGTAEHPESRAGFIDDLLREGYEPEEIRAAIESVEQGGSVQAAGGRSTRFRFLGSDERALVTPKAQALFVRLQLRGLVDPYQAEAIASWIRRAGRGRVGVRTLNEIVAHVCEGGEELLRLDGSRYREHLN